jgi:CBS domain-containing protein
MGAVAMTLDVIVVAPELDLAAAWKLMQREGIRHLLVMRGSQLVGILSDRDVLARGRWKRGGIEIDEKLLVVGAMSPAPYHVAPGARVADVARLMIEKQIDALPVVDAGQRVVGLVTSSDLVAYAAQKSKDDTIPFGYRVRSGVRSGL